MLCAKYHHNFYHSDCEMRVIESIFHPGCFVVRNHIKSRNVVVSAAKDPSTDEETIFTSYEEAAEWLRCRILELEDLGGITNVKFDHWDLERKYE